jgi:hypothetical protein
MLSEKSPRRLAFAAERSSGMLASVSFLPQGFFRQKSPDLLAHPFGHCDGTPGLWQEDRLIIPWIAGNRGIGGQSSLLPDSKSRSGALRNQRQQLPDVVCFRKVDPFERQEMLSGTFPHIAGHGNRWYPSGSLCPFSGYKRHSSDRSPPFRFTPGRPESPVHSFA